MSDKLAKTQDRLPDGSFAKGNQINSGANKKVQRIMARKFRECADNGDELIAFAFACLRADYSEGGPITPKGSIPLNLTDSEKFAAQKWAWEKIIERGFGKPVERVEIESTGDAPLVIIGAEQMRDLSDDELELMVKAAALAQKHLTKNIVDV